MNTSWNKSSRTHTYTAALPPSPNTSSRLGKFLRKTSLSISIKKKKIKKQISCIQKAFASITLFFCLEKPISQLQIQPKALQEFVVMFLVLNNQFVFSSLKKTSSSTLGLLQLRIAFCVGMKPWELSLTHFGVSNFAVLVQLMLKQSCW